MTNNTEGLDPSIPPEVMTPQEQLEAMQAYFTEIRERFAAIEEKVTLLQNRIDALERLDAQLENAKRRILEAERQQAAWQE